MSTEFTISLNPARGREVIIREARALEDAAEKLPVADDTAALRLTPERDDKATVAPDITKRLERRGRRRETACKKFKCRLRGKQHEEPRQYHD